MTPRMTRIGVVVIALLAGAACSKKSSGPAQGGGGGGDGKPQTLAIGDTGFVVDVPAGWVIKENQKGMFLASGNLGDKHRAVHIEEATFAASKPDELAGTACDGRKVATSEALPAAGAALTCTSASTAVQGVTMTLVTASIPRDANSSFSCFEETDHDPAPLLTICKSIRKK